MQKQEVQITSNKTYKEKKSGVLDKLKRMEQKNKKQKSGEDRPEDELKKKEKKKLKTLNKDT